MRLCLGAWGKPGREVLRQWRAGMMSIAVRVEEPDEFASRQKPIEQSPSGDSDRVFRIDTEFEDVRLMLRRWQAACIDGVLPPYEELALGSVGRFADELAVVRLTEGHEGFILRAGSRFCSLADIAEAPLSLSALPFAVQRAVDDAIDLARVAARPYLTLCRSIIDGMVSTMEVLALPLSSRWPGEYFLIFSRPRKSQVDLSRQLIN